ncbi:MAG: hypothetical protein Ct9H300mP19_01120 [Dehalococcoidia bacterium]|nr:MAG: hypothetical protein Ct9H300mP19_01120 [Dehalococcoidia bacterium]
MIRIAGLRSLALMKSANPPTKAGGPVGDEERERLSAFSDFIESFDIGDLDAEDDSKGGSKPEGDEPVAGD